MDNNLQKQPGKKKRTDAVKRIATRDKMRRSPDLPVKVDLDNTPDPEGELSTLKATDLVEFNRIAECEFVTIVLNLLAKYGAMRVREVCIEAAYRLDISIETSKRYLLKHSALSAQFNIEKGWVTERKSNTPTAQEAQRKT
jgi:hypothetical protein